jgi:hypothetical protein
MNITRKKMATAQTETKVKRTELDQHGLATRVVLDEFGDVVDVVINDNPQISLLVVLCDFGFVKLLSHVDERCEWHRHAR